MANMMNAKEKVHVIKISTYIRYLRAGVGRFSWKSIIIIFFAKSYIKKQ